MKGKMDHNYLPIVSYVYIDYYIYLKQLKHKESNLYKSTKSMKQTHKKMCLMYPLSSNKT